MRKVERCALAVFVAVLTTASTRSIATAIAPQQQLVLTGYFDTGTNSFSAPADEQSISWTTGGATQAPEVLTVTADANGNASVYGWGGNGVTGNQNSDTTYLNGFQVAAAAEPGSFVLMALSGTALFCTSGGGRCENLCTRFESMRTVPALSRGWVNEMNSGRNLPETGV